MDEFFVKDEKGEKGPFTFDELTDGRLEPDDLVRTPGSEWERAADLDGFSEYFRFEGYFFPTETNLAGFGIRFLAFFIDHFAISFVIGIGLNIFADKLPYKITEWDVKNVDLMLWLQEIYAVGLIVYNIVLCSLPLSSTLGQYLCRLVVVDANGQKISVLKAVIRGLAKLLSIGLYGLGTVSIFFTQYRQSLHDILARTYVIRRDVL
ncbi:RDD family protein [Mucilaginibacter aquatilis]|nr:RDD family protein [Mucilaginibacter aquatilis]